MSARQAFGPNLRRIRVQRGVSLEHIAETTKVSVDLWAALERNDLSRWPRGLFARAYVRDYARAIGVDPESTVDEFCRCFPHQGDRRAERLVRGHAEIVGHELEWAEELTPEDGERRGSSAKRRAAAPPDSWSTRLVAFRRLLWPFGRA